MHEIKHITKENFNNKSINIKDFALVECYNKMFAPSQIMQPILIKLKARFKNKFVHLRINITENQTIRDEFFIQNVPAYLIFQNGKFIDRIDGIIPYVEFIERVEKLLNKT